MKRTRIHTPHIAMRPGELTRQTRQFIAAGEAMRADLKADPSGRTSPRLLALLTGSAGDRPRSQVAAAKTNIVQLAPPASRRAPETDRTRTMSKFENLGQFMHAARLAASPGGGVDPRLVYASAPSTAGNEASGGDGGFLVPAELAADIVATVKANTIAGRCAQITSRTNNPTLGLDTESPWEASNVYWDSELTAITPSKPVFSLSQFRLNKITCLVPASSELVDDAPAFDSWARTIVPQKIGYKLTRALIRGTGAGQPRGLLNEPSLITVTRGGSVAATAAAMWKRLYGGGRGNAVFLVNPDVDVPTTPGLPLLLHGAPVIACEALSAAGTANDILLADLSQYALVMRALQIATSMHLYYDADAIAWRFILRCAGHGLWHEAKQPENGANTVSPFVTVAT